jgi:hypothetical protein
MPAQCALIHPSTTSSLPPPPSLPFPQVGQLGIGKEATFQGGTVMKFTKAAALPAGKAVTSVAAGVDFSLALAGGTVFAAGSQQYGQCGSGTTGEYIVSAGKTAFKELTAFRALAGAIGGTPCTMVAAGANHGVALSADGVPWTWGCGAYGRLGTGKPADVSIAAPVAFFLPERLRIKRVACGGTITMALTRMGPCPLLYQFGITKKSGEATMKPTYVSDITSMAVRDVAVGPSSTLVAADTSIVAWGGAPTFGELGFGAETKSSTKPKLVDDLEGCYALSVRLRARVHARGQVDSPATRTHAMLTPPPARFPPPNRSRSASHRLLSCSTRRPRLTARPRAQSSLRARRSRRTRPTSPRRAQVVARVRARALAASARRAVTSLPRAARRPSEGCARRGGFRS